MIQDIARIRIGDHVHYQPPYYKATEWENGIVKEVREDDLNYIWVVYHCSREWDRFEEYTSVRTNVRDLFLGWRYR